MKPWHLLKLLPLTFVLGILACAPVRPWQRAILAKPCMALTPDPEEAKTEQHLLAYREGSAGGYGDSGGGCGCN